VVGDSAPGDNAPGDNVPAGTAPQDTVPTDGIPAAEEVLAAVRERIADDLDAPGAVAAVDAWADAVLASPHGAARADADLVRDTADALLGITL
jgi:L-cysteine:1D-myo-inositol 2-amino-2-deoxy-alpha-D-glucopyranoside ligase